MNPTVKKVNLYLLAGVATAPLFMEGFRQAMTDQLRQDGWLVRSELLYPYGDWSRNLLGQLREMSHDLWLARTSPLRSIGGRRAAATVKAGCKADGLPLFIGHSGGGVAAAQAVQILAEEAAFHPASPPRVVQIGSPKCPIPAWLRTSVLYAGALNAKGKPSDPVTRLGNWGGWQRRGFRLPTWHSTQSAPSSIIHFPVIGGHPDYFRGSGPFLDSDGISNLNFTVQTIRTWLNSTFEKGGAYS